ncbi:secretin N-terminal domain-containing protein [Rubritalea tangerina]|uniref:Secretin N-terminal domain-containing protein n=1 Tax=Rubritalea tangerina TaxID=430798 RepID=A0ABW4ZAW4_9BACT
MKKISKVLNGLSTSFLLAGVASAQAPVLPEQPPEPPAPGAAPAQEKPLVDPNTILPEGVIEPQMSGEAIAQHYRKYTGKRVILTRAVQGVEISFVQEGKLSYREAADLLVKTCFLEGLVFVPSGPNEVKLLPAPNVRKAGGYPLVSDALLLPDGEELVTYVMGFDYIKPEEAMSIFTGVVSQLDAHGSVVPVPNANALIITENSQLIRTLISIKERIDTPQELSRQKWISLQHADAEETAENIRSIMEFSAQQNTQLSAGAGGAVATPAPNNANNRPGGQGNSNQNNRRAGGESFSSVQVLADVRTNRIFVIGRPIDVEVAEGLVAGFDTPLDERNFYKHKLKFLSVSEFLNIAENAITQVSVKSSDEAGGNQRSGNNRITSGQNRGQVSANGSFSQNNAGGNLAETSREEGPEAVIIGKTLLVADNSNNTLIIKGPPSSIKVVKDLIDEMDVVTDQVQITAIFGRYNLGDSIDFGVDFARTYQLTRGANSGFAAQNRTGYPILADPTTLTNLGAFDNVAGLSIYGQIGKHFTATLRAMEDSGKFHLMARPTVFTTNNRRAILSSGQQVAVPTNTFTQGGSGNNGSQSTNIAFRDILLELEVIPLVNSKNEVTLQISFVNNNIIGETVIDGNSIPTIGQESILTTVTVPNGETIVLGGLITERNESTESGIPVLMHIPGLKRLFSTIQKDVIREELVIFISPRIVNGRPELMDLQRQNGEKSQLVRDLQSGASVLPLKYSDPDQQDAATAEQKAQRRLWYLPDPTPENQPPTRNKNTFRGVRKR